MPLWVLLLLLILGVKKIPLWIIIVGYFAVDGLVRMVAWLQGQPKKQETIEPAGASRPIRRRRKVASRSESNKPPTIVEPSANVILLPSANITPSTQERPYMDAQIGALEQLAGASWNSVEHLVMLSNELQHRSRRRSLALRDSVEARIAVLRRQAENLRRS